LTCNSLSDPGFATPVKAEEPEKPALSEEELKKIKEEWEAKQKAKKEKEKEKAKEKDKEDKDKDKSKTPPKASTSSILSTPSPTPSTSSHAKYVLHRQIFAMRQSEHRKRRQVAQAKQIAPLLPFVPPGQLRDV
jgi:hypothetical protein